jgi:hypothetical protein
MHINYKLTFAALISYFPWTSSSSIGQDSNSSLCIEDRSINIGGRLSVGEMKLEQPNRVVL